MEIKRLRKWLGCISLGLAVAVSGCSSSGGGGGSGSSGTTDTTTTTALADIVFSTPSPAQISSDGQQSASFTITAVSTSNAAVGGAIIALKADTGILSTGTVTTETNGTSPAITFSSGTSNRDNRTATITATSGGITKTLQITIVGATVENSLSSSSIPADQTTQSTITITVKNGSRPAAAAPVSIQQSGGAGKIQFVSAPASGSISGTTDSNGVFTTKIVGSAEGSVTLLTTSLGASASSTVTVTAATQQFGISSVTETNTNTALSFQTGTVGMVFGDQLRIVVATPGLTSVRFSTTQGSFGNGLAFQTVAVSGGTATAVLGAGATAGRANVLVEDLSSLSSTLSATLAVDMSAKNPAKLLVQATPTTLPPSLTSLNVSRIVAKVVDANDQPVGNATVVFVLNNTTGGGEFLSRPTAKTASVSGNGVNLGEAIVDFTSGTLPTASDGIGISAVVVNQSDAVLAGPAVTFVKIGGTAGSVVLSDSTKITPIANDTAYELPMSVLVADTAGNPVANNTVTLSVWPVAFNTTPNPTRQVSSSEAIGTGTYCFPEADYWFSNEDENENLALDVGEDGTAQPYPITRVTAVTPPPADGELTPPNSAGGVVPLTVVTEANGVATFKLTYSKSSAIWTHIRLVASTKVQGTESRGTMFLTLPAADVDVGASATTCKLRNRYQF